MGFATARALAFLQLAMLFFAIYNTEARPESILPMPHDDGSNNYHLPPLPSPIHLPIISHPPFKTPKPLPLLQPLPHPLPLLKPLPQLPPLPPLPPFPFPKSFLAVQGFVYCKPCDHFNKNMFLGPIHLSGAAVKLQCNHTFTKTTQEMKGETDEYGYFKINAPQNVTSLQAHKCKVFLVSPSPKSICTKPSNLHGGIEGASLKPIHIGHTGDKDITVLYNVGPLAFQPVNCS